MKFEDRPVVIMDIIGLSTGKGGGLIGFLKKLRNRKVKEEVESEGNITVTVTDGNHITVNAKVFNLYQNTTIRQDLHGALKPLERHGIEKFRSETEESEITTVEKDEVAYFDPPSPSTELMEDEIRRELVEIVSPSFKDGVKWKFTQGEGDFSAALRDEDFKKRVAAGEAFRQGDVLRVRMRRKVTRTRTGLKALCEIIEVLQHVQAEEQPGLFDDEV